MGHEVSVFTGRIKKPPLILIESLQVKTEQFSNSRGVFNSNARCLFLEEKDT